MNASPGRSPSSKRTGASTAPRRETTRTLLAVARRRARARPRGDRSSVSPRRSGDAIPAGLHAGVVRVQPAAGREAHAGTRRRARRPAGRARRRLNGARGPRRPVLPEAAVQERLARMRPRRSTATGCRRAPRAARSSCRRASGESERSSSQTLLGVGSPQSWPEPPREVAEDRDVVARLARRLERLAARAARGARCWSPCPRSRTSRRGRAAPRRPARPSCVRKMSCTTRQSSPSSR